MRHISKEVQEIWLKWYDQVYRRGKENVRKSDDDDGCGGGKERKTEADVGGQCRGGGEETQNRAVWRQLDRYIDRT